MNLSEVTAVIKTFHRDQYMFNCVKTLKASYPEIHVIVVDDGQPSEEKRAKLTALGVEQYVPMAFNQGLCVGRNTGCKLVETPYVLIGDDDFTYSPACRLENLLSCMSVSDLAAGAVTLGPDGHMQHYEGYFNLQSDGGMVYKSATGNYLQHGSVRYEYVDLAFNFFIAKIEPVRSVLWDENIKVMYEHSDFFMRFKNAGYKVVYCPDSIVGHKTLQLQDSSTYKEGRFCKADRLTFWNKWNFPYMVDMGGIRSEISGVVSGATMHDMPVVKKAQVRILPKYGTRLSRWSRYGR